MIGVPTSSVRIKIEQDTYGRSDGSGEPIPRARLEAMPEAVSTVEQKQASE